MFQIPSDYYILYNLCRKFFRFGWGSLGLHANAISQELRRRRPSIDKPPHFPDCADFVKNHFHCDQHLATRINFPQSLRISTSTDGLFVGKNHKLCGFQSNLQARNLDRHICIFRSKLRHPCVHSSITTRR
jgi:hypothetical protein